MKFMLPELVAKPRNALSPDLDIVDPTTGRARIPSRRNKRPVIMYFGLGITVHQMSFYGHQEKLKTHHEVGQHLAKRFKAHPRLTAPVVTCEIVSNMDYDLVIALYSNYTRYDREVSEEREKHILKWVGKQFGIAEKECVGMWYEEDAHMKNSPLTDGLVWVREFVRYWMRFILNLLSICVPRLRDVIRDANVPRWRRACDSKYL